jgi:hypothetical protein
MVLGNLSKGNVVFRLRTVTGSVLIVALLAGGATVVKATMTPQTQSSAQEPPTEEIIPTPEGTLPSPEPTVEVDATPLATPVATAAPAVVDEDVVEVVESDDEVTLDDDEPDDTEEPDNHGSVVSTAAHCPVSGQAHGKLVSSIAKNKQATVGDAKAACAAALDEERL